MKYFQVVVPQGDDQKKKESVFQELLANLHNTVKNVPISLECFGYEQYTYFFFAVPDGMFETMEGLIYSTYPDCEIKETSDYVDSYKIGNGKDFLVGARMKLKFGDVYPFTTHDGFEEDSQSRLFSVISKIDSGDQVWFQIVA